jgi:peptidoglycan LD-endopeptidase CwlK
MLTDTSLARLHDVHPELMRRIVKLDVLVPAISLQVAQGLRTFAQQDALYAQGRTAPGPIVTHAKASQSAHCYGYAVDLVPEDVMPGQPNWDANTPAWQKMLGAGLAVGLAEGAKWRSAKIDNPHFYLQELPADPTDQMYTLFLNGGLQSVWRSWANLLQVTA